MTMNIRKISLLSISIVLLSLIVFVPRYSQAQDSMKLVPVVPGVQAGNKIRFIGTGFRRHERVDSWATDPTGAVLRGEYADSNGDGEVQINFRVPYDAIDGEWKITARGDQSRQTAWTAFDVYGNPELSVDFIARASPPVGPAGSTFAFAANGYDRREKISYWITGPDGLIYETFHRGDQANRHGRVDIEWISPTDAAQGRWVITMQGFESSKARAIPFMIDGSQVVIVPTAAATATPIDSQQVPDPTTAPTRVTILPTQEPSPTATDYPTTPPLPTDTPQPTTEPTATDYPTAPPLPTDTPQPSASEPSPTRTPIVLPSILPLFR